MRINASRGLRGAIAFVVAALICVPVANAQTATDTYKPRVGQAGKDVIWVPTSTRVVRRMLQLARTGPADFVVDLGAGDGRTVIEAAKSFGARSLGLEYNPKMVDLARANAAAAGVADRVEIKRADIFATDFSKATVVTMYLLSELNLRLRPKLLDMRPGTRIVSHDFNMAEWTPDRSEDVDGDLVYLWIVPARIAGDWTLQGRSGTLAVAWKQAFQKLNGVAHNDAGTVEILEPQLSGDRISFVLEQPGGVQARYIGRVTRDSMQGTVKVPGNPDSKWTARREGGP